MRFYPDAQKPRFPNAQMPKSPEAQKPRCPDTQKILLDTILTRNIMTTGHAAWLQQPPHPRKELQDYNQG